MYKLFQITCRWLKRDKKRTALTFWSIVLAVYLISFVGVYLSTALSSYREAFKYEEPYHAQLYLNDIKQADTLDKNVAWDGHCLYVEQYDFMAHQFLNSYTEEDGTVFPFMEINGENVYKYHVFHGEMIDGDAEAMLGDFNFGITGRLPERPHEVAISPKLAARYGGLNIGDTFTLRIGKQKGKFYYAEEEAFENIYPPEELIRDEDGNIIRIEHVESDENGSWTAIYLPETHKEPKRDDDGNVIYIEDTDGSMLKEIYANQRGWYDFFIYEKYMDPDASATVKDTFFENYGTIPPGYAVLSDEKELVLDYTATVTGITDSDSYSWPEGTVMFSREDTDILPCFDLASINYYVRVKPGIDAEKTVSDALDSIGIVDDPWDPTDDDRYFLNKELLVLEGRQLEYIGDLGSMIVAAAIIMFMFVFLARLIINNAFEISAAYRTEQYGALKTVGASNKQIFLMIMFECALYMLTALPIGFFAAVGTGKLLLGKIREIGVFDPIYGTGVSERFFSLELSPTVMIITFACAAFSIFFSSYADAMRVRRLPPIQSVGYGSTKKIQNKRSRWLSRRFGYPTGFAFKCISKEKVRFTVTLLAAVMSGIFIMAFAGVGKMYSDTHTSYVGIGCDIYVQTHYRGEEEMNDLEELKSAVSQMNASGYYKDVILQAYCYLTDGESSGENDKYYTDEYLELNSLDYRKFGGRVINGMEIMPVTRELYDKYVSAGMTYDEFIASGKVLLCNSCAGSYYRDSAKYERYWVDKKIPVKDSYDMGNGICIDALDIQMFNTKAIDELVFTGDYFTKDRKNAKYTETVKIAGFYETTHPELMNASTAFKAIMPIENFTEDMFECQKDELYPIETQAIELYVNDGHIGQVRTQIEMLFPDNSYYDAFTDNVVSKNLVDTFKIAGYGFALTLAAVVLLNIFSTTSANMINRRRDLNMMRSCGMSIKQVRNAMFAEARIYAVITTLVASVIGWIMAMFFYNVLIENSPGSDAVDWALERIAHFPWLAALLVFAVIMIVMSLAIIPSLMSMKKQNIAEEIRTDL